ncbi:cyclic-di-AMP-binding protein CbpB [Lentilactobacillus sp. SPB1-3]|uniref:Cyclic-di-AMP-binding protein CbpB n=1 Tax=Lentilactobacillus terminaliae TaxID=3003483 RepID=A0ACD5DCA9_9LACO|nr:cyclic-di-AMP-binding protein CbpB [Lentilactobacillus sp. SPB1-3]MCZ0977353.1 CBS domain-containing protein [Lentilactobacillus sp. SPB1-3]
MIDKPIEAVLRKSERQPMIDADLVATVNENAKLSHSFLVLTKVKYAKIPVLNNDNQFKGMLSLQMITEKMLTNEEISSEPLHDLLVKDVMQTGVPVVKDPDDIEIIMHYLEDENFLPVVDDNNKFLGICTRREIMKQFNYLTHNFTDNYVALPAYNRNEDEASSGK